MNVENEPATKKDLQELEARIDARLVGVESRVEGKLDAMEDRLKAYAREMAEQVETRILRAFHAFAEANHSRLRLVEGGQANLVERVGKLEERVFDLEKRLPPAA